MGWILNPAIASLVQQEQGVTQATSPADPMYRNFFKGFLNKGKDISNITAFQPALQAGATHKAMLGESAGYGDAGLIGSQGTPEQKAVLGRQAEIAGNRADENTAMGINDMINPLIQSGSQYGVTEAGNTNAFNLGQFQIGADALAQGSSFQQSPWWGILQSMAGNAAKAGAAAAI